MTRMPERKSSTPAWVARRMADRSATSPALLLIVHCSMAIQYQAGVTALVGRNLKAAAARLPFWTCFPASVTAMVR